MGRAGIRVHAAETPASDDEERCRESAAQSRSRSADRTRPPVAARSAERATPPTRPAGTAITTLETSARAQKTRSRRERIATVADPEGNPVALCQQT
jgi:hypothetical protein